ncbi:MAG: 2,3-bisphosphoglycerate-independent phosphoglycerate mutase [Opitutales bacterium]
MSDNRQTPVLLVIRDGWGINNDPLTEKFNAVKQAETPVSDRLTRDWPWTQLAAHGPDVGLPEGIMGNSEVGHQNIGAGRIVDQEIMRINKGFAAGTLLDNPVLKQAFDRAKGGGALHLFGIVSDAGVHGMLDHLYGLLALAKDAGLDQVNIHAFTDGRDTPPKSGLGYIRAVEAKCREIGIGRVASVCGRYWAMDRDNRWDRVEKAYRMLVGEAGDRAGTAEEAVQRYYDEPAGDSMVGDEFIQPTAMTGEKGGPLAPVRDGDAVVFYNYRGDRPREITRAFIDPAFDGFDRGEPLDLFYATMTDYQKGLCPNIVFPKPPKMKGTLGEAVSAAGLKQFRCAETEKYPHVTFFFNDYREEPWPGEDRKVEPSPQVPTYDEQPEMSAAAVAASAAEAIRSGQYALVVVNFANPDMVGHTGSMPATIQACEATDQGLGVLLEALDAVGGKALVTADHGNADLLYDATVDGPHTSHTLNPVELIVYGAGCRDLTIQAGDHRLADIAPTVLKLMGLAQPPEMTGECLIEA